MKHEEAIRWLKMQSSKPVKWDDYSEENKQIREEAERRMKEAFNMAIEALKAQEPEALDMPKPDSDIGCWYDITHNYTLEQVVSALKSQEPRVMTLEELVADDVVWLEDCDKGTTVPGIYCASNDTETIFATRMKGYLFVKNDEYGKRWRCWASRPTAEQREAMAWN